jgi:hypothetical protein
MHIPMASADVTMNDGSVKSRAPSAATRAAWANTIKKKMRPEANR